ncbi:MAG: alginate lyase family protein [Candidatus Hydrogenedentes bacterium]|nr:alginate lyase family protein [Candidatus Hydrogenedentota bacterium]
MSITLLRYLHTLRTLRPVQWWWLLRYRVYPGRPVLRAPLPQAHWNEEVCARLLDALDAAQAVRPLSDGHAAELREGHFHILSEIGSMEPEPQWHSPNRSRLWNYHLHYFHYARLLAQHGDPRGAAAVARWMDSWIRHNPPGTDIAWDAYTISLRVVNWILAAARWPELRFAIEESLVRQIQHLAAYPEYDLQANHLFRNATALSITGAALGLSSIQRQGESLLSAQCKEQFFPDGGHYERSPMYHAEILNDLLLVHAVLDQDAAVFRAHTSAAAAYLAGILHGDGRLPLFGDAAEDPCASARSTVGLAQRILGMPLSPPAGSRAFPHTGIHVIQTGPGAVWIKTGGVSPNYQPGHTHCDMLSFEYDYQGRPIAVDSGTHGYAESPHREYNRATRAHNTTMLDGVEQHECWPVFRVARRGACSVLAWEPNTSLAHLAARCENFRGRAFTRVIAMSPEGGLLVVDQILPGAAREATSWLHLHPGCTLRDAGGVPKGATGVFTLQCEDASLGLAIFGWNTAQASDQDSYSPQMGLARTAPVLCLSVAAPLPNYVGYTLLPPSEHPRAAEHWAAAVRLLQHSNKRP